MPDSAPAPDIARRLDVARAIAEDAADHLRGAFRRGAAQVSAKADGTVVTEADREVEAAISSAIEAAFPEDGRLGEEHGEVAGASGVRWVIDPIDGTFSFIRGVPLFGTLIGIEADGRPAAGVIAMPALHEMVWGGPGLGAWRSLEGEVTPARVSAVARAEEALFCTTGLGAWRRGGGGRLDTFTRLATTFGRMRGWSDCYAYTLLATGRCDVVIEPELNWWDIAAVIPIIEAAGGRVTDWQGQPCAPTGTIATFATNGLLHGSAQAAVSATGAPVHYWRFGRCPRCGDCGSLMVAVELLGQAWIVRCDECAWTCQRPPEASDFRNGYEASGRARFPTEAEIDAAGWRHHCKEELLAHEFFMDQVLAPLDASG